MRLNFRNYDHVAGLWKHENWLPQAAVALARTHYAAYMVKRVDGLRIITLNTDMCTVFAIYNVERRSSWTLLFFIQGIGRIIVSWRPGRDLINIIRANYFNYLNMTNPDNSGMLRFLTDELQDAEDAGDKGQLIHCADERIIR